MQDIVSAKVIAAQQGVCPEAVREWAKKGWIPSIPHGKQARFDPVAVAAALDERKTRKAQGKRCTQCRRMLPHDRFPRLYRADREPSRCSWCYECRAKRKRKERRARAVSEGREFVSVEEKKRRAAERIKARKDAEKRRREEVATTKAARQAKLKAQGRMNRTLTAEETARSVARQRDRYNSDPEYQARRKAKNIRRKRAILGADVQPVDRERVAFRDGWKCGICGGVVTREDWSLDHIVPLSKGGSHTYKNVTLAHRSCNSARGAGRLAVQAPLFAVL